MLSSFPSTLSRSALAARYKNQDIEVHVLREADTLHLPMHLGEEGVIGAYLTIRPVKAQERELKKLLRKAQFTEFGRHYHFTDILLSKNITDPTSATIRCLK